MKNRWAEHVARVEENRNA